VPSTNAIIVSSRGGVMRFIYSDALAPLVAEMTPREGDAQVLRRVSNVEPTADGRWTADMRLFDGGPVLGPFTLRQDALDAEVAYLHAKGL
jgi:hypothetical protein